MFKPDSEEIVAILLFTFLIIFTVFIIGSCYWEDMNATYINITDNVTGKWEDEYTTTAVYSNGKCAWTLPVTHHDYILNTSYGTVTVDPETYKQYNVNDTIQFTYNVNKTVITEVI